jgi:toxin ParE1/3/4
MELKWSKIAAQDLVNIRKFIHRNKPAVAKEVALKIAALAETLIQHPAKGRTGRLPNTRELIVPELPYIIVYRAKKQQIEILRVIHTSTNWPT